MDPMADWGRAARPWRYEPTPWGKRLAKCRKHTIQHRTPAPRDPSGTAGIRRLRLLLNNGLADNLTPSSSSPGTVTLMLAARYHHTAVHRLGRTDTRCRRAIAEYGASGWGERS